MCYNRQYLFKTIYNSYFFIKSTLVVSMANLHTFFYYLYKSAAAQPVVILLWLLLVSQFVLSILPNINSIIQHWILEVEPKNAVVRLSVKTVLLCLFQKRLKSIVFVQKMVSTDHLEEWVTILRSELNCKLKILYSFLKWIPLVCWIVTHSKSCTFTPHFSRFRNFFHSLFKSSVNSIKILHSFTSQMLKLNQNSPESTRCKVQVKTIIDNLLRFLEKSTPHMHHDSFKLYFPFTFCFILGLNHNLYCSFVFSNYFKVLCIFKKSNWNLFWWDVKTCPFDTETWFFHHTLVLHDAWRDKPELPFHILWAI